MKTIDNKIARTLALVVSLMLSFPVFGQNADAVDLRLASRVGENFIKLNPNIALSGEPGSLRRVETDKFPNLYIFNADEHGWIIVAGDKRVQPILGFSDEGTFNPNDMAPAAEMIIGSYNYVVDSMLRYNVRSVDESVRQAWIDLENGYYREVKGNRDDPQPQYPLAYGPLIKTRWGQGDRDPNKWPGNYNQFCPWVLRASDNAHFNAVTGCTATAMAQILYYFNVNLSIKTITARFLKKSNDNYVYCYNDSHNREIYSQKYHNDSYENYTPYEFEIGGWDYSKSGTKELAAKMMRDCGLSVNMRYGLTGSGAKYTDAYNSFKLHFGFDNAEKEYTTGSFNDEIHVKKFQKHIVNNIPIYYRGCSNKGSYHAFIIDGYNTFDNNVYFHHNFGWEGSLTSIDDGYYLLNSNRYYSEQAYIIVIPITEHDTIVNDTINFGESFHRVIEGITYDVSYGNNYVVNQHVNGQSLLVYNEPGEYHIKDVLINKNVLVNIMVLPDNVTDYNINRIICKGEHYIKRIIDDDGNVYAFNLSPEETNYDGSQVFVRYSYDKISGSIIGKCTLTLTTEECNNCVPDVNGLNNGINGNKDGQTTNQIIYESVTKYHEYVSVMNDFMSRVLMDAYLHGNENSVGLWNLFQSLLDSNTGMISEEGIQQLISQSPFENISVDYIEAIAQRYNQSVIYWNEGYYSNDSLPEDYISMIEYDTAAMRKAYEAQAYAESLGFSDVRQMYDNAYEMLETEIENIQSAVCARVTVQFTQKMTMTREAFNGTLQIFNGHESIPMQDIMVDFRIEDQQGNDCTNLFQINTLSLDQITGISGDGSLAAQTNGTALVQFIPTKNAAPTQPVVYSFGGSFSFIDPFTGEGLTYPLYPVDITVNPSPDLYVDYFMQRDILGDDALTLDVVEPSVPAELGVIIHNQGAGMAKNVMLETAEPQIIDNEKGLAINFAMYGASFNGSPRQLGLTEIRFGNIESHQTAVGEWLFTSSLLGHFVSYEAHVIHNSSYGNQDLSLVSHLDIHELIHPIYAYGNLDDGINDFLVNDSPDAYDTPDSIYFSNGGKTSVGVVDGISFDHLVSPSDTIVTLTVVPSRVGWNYGVTDDPGMNVYRIVSCIRNNDNQVIPLNNVWQTFVTIPDGGDPVYENKLHIVDTLAGQQTTTYTLVFEYSPDAGYNMAQDMSLSQGWNWWSTYIEQGNINGLTMLENSLGHKGVTIKSQFDFVQNFYPDYGVDVWFGSLEGLANEQGYMIDVTEDCSISMAGVRAKPVSHPITIYPNWNWIGYPVTSRQSVTSALADYNALPEDLIKSHYEFSVYYDGFGWFPDDLVMIPGEGYFYYSNAAENQTLMYNNGSRGEVLPERSDKRIWKTNVHAFADNISIMAVVSIDSVEQRDENLELGAFVNGECRGSARLKHFGPSDRYYAMLSIAGQEGDMIEFGFVNKEKGQGSMSCENQVAFVRNDVVGSLDAPYVVRFNTQKEVDQNGFMVLFPNPVERNKTFSLAIPKDETLVEIVVVDMLGEEVLRKSGALKPTEIAGLPVSGIYVVKAVTRSGNVYYGRLVVK